MQQPHVWLTTSEAAAEIRTSADYVARQCDSKAIKAKKVGNSWRIHRDDLESFMRGAEAKAPATRVRRRRAS